MHQGNTNHKKKKVRTKKRIRKSQITKKEKNKISANVENRMYRLLLLLLFCFIVFSFRNKQVTTQNLGCNEPTCDIYGLMGNKECNAVSSGYEMTPLRLTGFDYTPLHNIWSDPDYLSDSWCANPHDPTPNIEYVDPDYRIRNCV